MTRKIDTCGRVMIPAKVREKYNLTAGREVEMTETVDNGHLVLHIDCGDVTSQLKAMLEAAGLKVVEE